MGVSRGRRALGAAIAAVGVIGWIFAIALILGQENTLEINYTAWALVPISGAVVMAGGLLMGVWG
jgi:hypothetical protein